MWKYVSFLQKWEETNRGYIHMIIVSLSFIILLGTVYTQQQPYRYIHSHGAMESAYNFDAAVGVSSLDEIWEWIVSMESSFGGRLYHEVQANCAQPDPPSKLVAMDGVPVSIFDTEPNYISCAGNMEFLKSVNRTCYSVGNQQLLLFGLFTDRSYEERPLNGAGDDSVLIHSSKTEQLSAYRDSKVVTTCSNATATCVLEDAYSGSAASTLNWQGEYIDGTSAFTANSTTQIYETERLELRPVRPCRTIDSSGKVEINSLVDEGECKFIWLTDGIDIHNQCLRFMSNPPSPGWAYAAAKMGLNYTGEAFDMYFLCTHVMDVNFARSVYITGQYNLPQYLSKQQMHGVFFGMESQDEFMDDFNTRIVHLQMHGFLDDSTRHLLVYIFSRNLGQHELFYTMTTITFSMKTTGQYTTSTAVHHVPIIQYTYGSPGYEWLHREVLVFEVLVLIVIGVVLVRSVYHIILVAVSFGKTRVMVVRPSDMTEKQSQRFVDATLDHGNMDPDEVGNLSQASKDEESGVQIHESGATPSHKISHQTDIPDDRAYGKILDVVMLAVLFVGIVYRVSYCVKAGQLHNYLLSRNGDFDDHVEEIVADFHSITSVASTIKVVSIVAIAVGLGQFFRYISLDPRMNIVTSTILHSLEDLIPVLLIFIVVLVSYGVLGTEIYGDKIGDWSNLSKSLGTMFIILLGEFGPYFEMKRVNPLETTFYFWTFIVIILFLLLNMVLAVIFTVYDLKREELNEAKASKKTKSSPKNISNCKSDGHL